MSAAIGSLLARNDPLGVRLFRQFGDRLDPSHRYTLGAAAEMLSNTIDAATWLRNRSATLAADKAKAQPPQGAAPAPTGDAALDAVNAASASATEPPPFASSGGMLFQREGVAGYGQRMVEIEDRRRALTALNDQEFAGNPARQRANQTAIESDSARGRAAVKADADKAYAHLRRYLTTGGPGGGRAVTLPPATLLSRFTGEQQASIMRQVDRAIEGRPPTTDPRTWYAILQRLTGDDANGRERWASTNLVQFMDRLSDEDYAALAKLQTVVRTNDSGAETTRLQAITRMANQALRKAGIDPTPSSDRSPDSDVVQAARFHRALQDELSAFESGKGRKATAAEAQDIVNRLNETAIKGGWLKVSDRPASPTVASGIPTTDDGVVSARAEPPAQPEQGRLMPSGMEQLMGRSIEIDAARRLQELDRQRKAAEQPTAGTGGSEGAPAPKSDPGSFENRAADGQARNIVAEQGGNPSEVQRAETSAPPTSRGASMAVPAAPGGAVLGTIGEAALEAGRFLWRAAPAAGTVATAGLLMLIPTNTQETLHPIGENLRVRTAPGQLSATVQSRVDDGLFSNWIDLPVKARWTDDQRYIAVDQRGLEQAIGRDAVDAALAGSGIAVAMAKPPSKDDPGERDEPGPGHNSEAFGKKPTPEPGDEDPKPPLDPAPLALPAIDAPDRVRSRINLYTGNSKIGWIHATKGHFDPARTGKSQFTISKAELRALLQTREVVRSPIVRVLKSREGPRYVREVTFNGRNIGIDASTKSPTSTLTVLTDKYGNLVTTHPGRMQ